MYRGTLVALLVLVLLGAVLMPGCQKISVAPRQGAGVPVEILPAGGTVPASWGDLVSTSSAPEYPEVVQLWFRDSAGTVRMVVYHLASNELLHARVIRRSGEDHK
jgi:hypothetical protein